MKHCPFSWTGATSVAKALSVPFDRASVWVPSHGRPIAITLWRGDGTGLRIGSRTNQVAPRIEVGTLEFAIVDRIDPAHRLISIDKPLGEPVSASKLVIEQSGTCFESGFALEASDGRTFTVVSGVYPNTLAISGLVEGEHFFEPEYPLTSYLRMPLGIDQ
jgi:hypothetical protein